MPAWRGRSPAPTPGVGVLEADHHPGDAGGDQASAHGGECGRGGCRARGWCSRWRPGGLRPAAARATTSAWGPPGGGWPRRPVPSTATSTHPTQGLGEVLADGARPTARGMLPCPRQSTPLPSGSVPPGPVAIEHVRNSFDDRRATQCGYGPGEQVEGVGDDVDHRVERLDGPAGRAGGVQDQRLPHRSGHGPREPPSGLTRRIASARPGASRSSTAGALGGQVRGPNPVPPVVTTSPANPAARVAQRLRRPARRRRRSPAARPRRILRQRGARPAPRPSGPRASPPRPRRTRSAPWPATRQLGLAHLSGLPVPSNSRACPPPGERGSRGAWPR